MDSIVAMQQKEDKKMEAYEKIQEILSTDEHAQAMMTRLNEVANTEKLTNEQYQNGKVLVFLIAVRGNQEAFKTLSDSVWKRLNPEIN